jgi:hypothetical protein
LINFGLFEKLDLRLTLIYQFMNVRLTDDYSFYENEREYSGVSSPLLGVKYRVLQEGKWLPNLGASFSSYLPGGSGDFQTDYFDANVRFTAGKTIIGSWYLLLGYGLHYYDVRFKSAIYTAQTGIGLFKNLTFIAEYYKIPLFNSSVPRESLHFVNLGLTYLMSRSHQIDLSYGWSIHDGNSEIYSHPNFHDHYFALGYSFRFHL